MTNISVQHLREYLLARYSPEFLDLVGEFLNELRLSGVVNMYGASTFIYQEFYIDLLDEVDAHNLLQLWMFEFKG